MSLTEKVVDFKSLEQKIHKMVCRWGCELLKQVLESYDSELSMERDRKEYRHKGSRTTTIKTVMGEVEYKRAVYQHLHADGTKRSVFLLDEALGMDSYGLISGNLAEMIALSACEGTFRSAARAVSDLTGQSISHTAAWHVVQELGERVDRQEQRAANAAAAHKGVGTRKSKLLFEEQDGIWLNLQGNDRKIYGKSREMKLAIAYDGAKQTGKTRFALQHKVACASFEAVGAFQKRKEGVIAETYDIDEIEMRFLNGDGAQWIRQSQTDETVHFQLDPFHRNQAIRQWVNDEDMRKQIMEWLYAKDIDGLLLYIEACSNSVEDEAERKNLLSLLTYFTNNKDGLVPCHRRGLDLPPPPKGVEYRRMGCMESNVFTLIGNRMKGRRACWSIKGGNHLARLLCLKATQKLSETLSALTSLVLPEKYSEEITVNLSAKKVPLREGMGYNGFRNIEVPSSLPWLKALSALAPLSEIKI